MWDDIPKSKSIDHKYFSLTDTARIHEQRPSTEGEDDTAIETRKSNTGSHEDKISKSHLI